MQTIKKKLIIGLMPVVQSVFATMVNRMGTTDDQIIIKCKA